MKRTTLLLLILFCSFSLVYGKNNSSKMQATVIDVSSLNFDSEGQILDYEFRRTSCSETRNGVTFTASVGCFLCGEERTLARCQRVLSQRLDNIEIAPVF